MKGALGYSTVPIVPVRQCSLKICGWNPNGLKALMRNNPDGVRHLILNYKPDILIYNETKGSDKKQTETSSAVEAVMPGFKWLWNNSLRGGMHGVAVAYNPNLK